MCVNLFGFDDAHAHVMLNNCTLQVGIQAGFRQLLLTVDWALLDRVASIGLRHLFLLLLNLCL